jgi:ABC-type sugar transport system substrate-binding protein
MPHPRQFLALITSVLFVVPLLNCGGSGHSADELYILVSTNIQVPYWKAAGAGLSQAASQLKVRYEFVGPDDYDPKAEKEAFDKALSKKPTGILISAADAKSLTENIDRAIASGVPVITMIPTPPTASACSLSHQ